MKTKRAKRYESVLSFRCEDALSTVLKTRSKSEAKSVSTLIREALIANARRGSKEANTRTTR